MSNDKTNGKLKIAVQKSDRIANDFLNLLDQCGIHKNIENNKLYCSFDDFPLEIYFIRGCDIKMLMQKTFDVAILGMDSFLQYQMEEQTEIVKKLGFSKCHLSFAGINTNSQNWEIQQLQNKVIATSYDNILQDFLNKNNINSKIIKMNGSVEISIKLGLADYIFDIVQTGTTLKQHGLIELKNILNLEAILIKNKNFSNKTFNNLIEKIDNK